MWVGKGLTPWFHGVPTVITRGACQILGRVAGQFSHFFQVERHMAYTLSKVRITLNISVICTLLKLGIVFVTSVIYHWNQRISESQDQNNTWPTQECYLFPPPTVCIRDDWEQLSPLFSFTVGISASVRVRMMYAGVSDPHLPQWMMWVRKGLTPWFHGVPTVMTRGACQILGRVAGQFSHFFQVERHMAYTLV
ncbi:hypothetical protein PROFUN_01752 [Planoprotostelium fungivorum]|uniref:Uncharacterized protein n=1 Tax=Planoprotostelium fungivorum TaxID=1890364 RepID=A0A2P6MWL5_9EUKA|nr:hypothetical protein PROFUN_01752 [Planoprotostelium fungivorum]